MDNGADTFEILKQILRQARHPQSLDDHRWTQSLFVRDALQESPALRQASPGQQLIAAIDLAFKQLQPSRPPKRGKRIDPRWGEFGLLSALYFTPFQNGTSFPTSFMDAWARIDHAVLYAVFGRPAEAVPAADAERYRIVGDDVEYGSASTLSDWHKKGVQRLSDVILNRERFLARTTSEDSPLLEQAPAQDVRSVPRQRRALVWWSLVLAGCALIGLLSWKAWRIYERGMLLYDDVAALRELRNAPLEPALIEAASLQLGTVQQDLSAFRQEAWMFLWMCPRLGWVPVYGGDLESAPQLLEIAEGMISASLLSAEAAQPFLQEFESPGTSLETADLAALLLQAEPQLLAAGDELDKAIAARERIDADGLSPRLRRLVVEEIDTALRLARDGLSLAVALPDALGAGSEGPKTYLLLVQNEDELRPTGGFITSVGNLVLHNGQILRLEFESVDTEQEDWSQPYPAAPWQLQEYMNSPVLILRDANWFSDFPTTAAWVEYLYAYTHSHSVDGILAFDQQLLVMLLAETGPLKIENAPDLLTDQNVIEYMRQAKIRPTGPDVPADWDRKDFIGEIASPLLSKITRGSPQDWLRLGRVVLRALEERHLVLQFDDPVLSSLAAERGWDNAIRAEGGDYLLVTDTNIGFNKTNAVVDVGLTYDADLTDLDSPVGTLMVTHRNNARSNIPCVHWNEGEIPGEEKYPINRCYWSYLRVYKPAGVELMDATPHAIPGEWMLFGDDVPARVDPLEEELPGVQGFGTLLVVPGGQSQNTSFQFALPASVLAPAPASGEHAYAYHLTVHKQPGTKAHPLTIRIHLPAHAQLESIPAGAVLQDNHLFLETTLRIDLELDIVFTLP